MMLQVSSSPHIRDNATSQRLMLDVIIALIPAVIASVWIFGAAAAIVIAVTTGTAVIFEYISRKVMKRYNSIADLSAVVTGLLLALNLPPTIPLWMAVTGSFIAIVVVKQMFGGIGHNFVNPAMAARVIMTISYPAAMTRWAVLERRIADSALLENSESIHAVATDLVSTATPLYLLQNNSDMPSYLDLFLGIKGGCLGEISIAALTIGIIYLVIRKVITLWLPLTYIGTVALITFAGGQDPLYHVLSGGLFLGAFFMATDYVTSPMTRKGKIIFGLGCGVITAIIRLFGGMTEGVSFSILFMNTLTPHIDRWTIPVPFGGGVKHAKG
ncbi:MAG: H+/Na+-translocating ferredoxin:NAD+ oxidoreductase subunit [Clostridiales bacterium]|nr:H+/Na+-translocating ferredoxin:NAD+ oxidoreductase subunit [Clostridiales bacterium]